MKRIGIYSGTFDPVHNGHIGFALQAAKAAKLDQVVFLPEKSPRDKVRVTSIGHRYELLRRATEPHDKLSVRLLDTSRFSVQETLPQIQAMFGGARLALLVGSDVVRTFSGRWPDLDQLFSGVDLVIGLRQGDTADKVADFLDSLQVAVKPNTVFVASPMPAVSSSQVRSGVALGDMPAAAMAYARQRGLYGLLSGASDASA